MGRTELLLLAAACVLVVATVTPPLTPPPPAPTLPPTPPDPGSKKPHILYILADDFGWGDADWHRPANWTEKATPNMMKLIKQGVELDQMYAFKVSKFSRFDDPARLSF